MASFTDVVAGNPTLAADINQYADRLNGTIAAQISLLGAAGNNYRVLNGILPSVQATDSVMIAAYVSGDGQIRYAAYIRGSDGYGGIQAGNGTSVTAHWYAQSGGWKTDENVSIVGTLTVQGTVTIPGLTVSNTSSFAQAVTLSSTLTVQGTSSLDNGAITTDGSGNITAAAFKGKHQTIRNGTAQVNTIFTGTNTPSNPATGDIWVKA
jgi:hypothetical protein